MRKTRRRYDSSGRRARASEARGRILSTARALFAARGLDRVTLEGLARQAGVSTASVYAQFGSKAGILRALMEESLFNAAYRPLSERARKARDPEEALRLTASVARAIYDGEKAGLGVLRGASAFSAELRDVEEQFERIRYRAQRSRALRIARPGTVRPGLCAREVRDLLWMFTGRDVYRMLVGERGWSSAAYQAWLGDTLVRALLADPPRQAPSGPG